MPLQKPVILCQSPFMFRGRRLGHSSDWRCGMAFCRMPEQEIPMSLT